MHQLQSIATPSMKQINKIRSDFFKITAVLMCFSVWIFGAAAGTRLRIDSSYVFQSTVHSDGKDFGKQSAWHTRFEYDQRIGLSGWLSPESDQADLSLKLGVRYGRFDFSGSYAPLPDLLQDFSAVIALEYLSQGGVAFSIETRPGFYFSHDISGQSFDSPTLGTVTFAIIQGRFYVVGGIWATSLGEYPIIPLGGVLWHISDQWELRCIVPDPRLVYTPVKGIEVWVGGQVTGGAYRTDRNESDSAKLNAATLQYYEWRAGGGITCTRFKPFVIDLIAGYAIERVFNYHRAGETFRADGASYIRAQIKAEF